MLKYLIEFKKSKSSLIVEYNDTDELIFMELRYGKLTEKGRRHIASHIPYLRQHIQIFQKSDTIQVHEIHQDVSFKTFWDSYDNKFGNKSRAERTWESFNQEQKIKALQYIQVYNQWLLKNQGVNKKLPETYLNQQPWNN